MVAVPTPGLEPTDIGVVVDGDRVTIEGKRRGQHQDDVDLIMAEWTIGPYYRELALDHPIRAELINVTYDNRVLVLVMPKRRPGQKTRAAIRLETIRATRGSTSGTLVATSWPPHAGAQGR
jgi:HSP20 family molecular chaperone IbpA